MRTHLQLLEHRPSFVTGLVGSLLVVALVSIAPRSARADSIFDDNWTPPPKRPQTPPLAPINPAVPPQTKPAVPPPGTSPAARVPPPTPPAPVPSPAVASAKP